MQEIWLLRSACHLMLIDIYKKFCEDSLNGFQVIEHHKSLRDRQTNTQGENNVSQP